MRILVTGGLGTIGKGLVSELRKRGNHVVSCDLYHDAGEIGFSVGTDLKEPLYARCDISKFQQIERVFEAMAQAQHGGEMAGHLALVGHEGQIG